jgi:hypothetical protein
MKVADAALVKVFAEDTNSDAQLRVKPVTMVNEDDPGKGTPRSQEGGDGSCQVERLDLGLDSQVGRERLLIER